MIEGTILFVHLGIKAQSKPQKSLVLRSEIFSDNSVHSRPVLWPCIRSRVAAGRQV